MCEMQKYPPLPFFNAQEHYLIHQVEEIEMCGPIHTRSMQMVERHLKSLKDFFTQRARPKGSMVVGYMVYQYLVYISQYIPKLATEIMKAPRILDFNSINKFEWEVLVRKGKMRKVKYN